MRLCLMIEGQEGVTWAQWQALAEACERSGLEGLFRSDHYLGIGDGEGGSMDAWTTLAALAARTGRIRLGTMVSPATFRHPSVLANAATTVDHVSGGRVELGLGAGWYEAEHSAFGFPFPPTGTRMEMFEEQAEIIVSQWTRDRFSFAGRHYTLTDCRADPKPVQRPHPPLIVGGSGKPRTVAAAVRFAQEYNVVAPTVAEARDVRARIDAACQRAGRDPATLVLSAMSTVLVGSGRDELRRRARTMIDRGYGDGETDPDGLVAANRDTWVCGMVDEAVERLGELREAGVERVMLQHLLHDDVDAVDLFGSALH